MKLTEIQFDLSEVRGPDHRPRAAGLHLSDIIRDISNTALRPGQRQKDSELSPSELQRLGTYRTLGFMWERALQRSLIEEFATGACVRPGEYTVDGISMNPDLLDIANDRIEEWKCTWKSSRRWDNLEDEFVEWFWQIKGYLKALHLNEAVLRVFFVNGDYRESGPQIKCCHLYFTPLEVHENWEMIKRHAKRMKERDGHGTKVSSKTDSSIK